MAELVEIVCCRLPLRVAERLRGLAQEEHRPLANLLRLIVERYLEALEEGSDGQV